MPKPRYSQISLSDTPYYHCVSRCVRRAFLCGTDAFTGQCYEHRRQWVEDKILALSGIFALDVCAYAVMSNHYHVVLHINEQAAHNWSKHEVIERWHRLFKGHAISRRYLNGEALTESEMQFLAERASTWKARLLSISWFMRVLNEGIARQANQEDDCTGRFWEGRFKTQALLGEAALMACMAYVDLNPVRAGLAKRPETSDHTSIKQRISSNQEHSASLFPFVGNPRADMPQGLPFNLTDYIELLDWTGRQLRSDKHGVIEESLPPILERLNQNPLSWLYASSHFESKFKQFVGAAHLLKRICQSLGFERCSGLKACFDVFG